MKSPKMCHSMVSIIEEKGLIMAVGGEDGHGNLLDKVEIYSVEKNMWKVLNCLKNPGKNMGICKFLKQSKTAKGEKQVLIYVFGRNVIERINLDKVPLDEKWEEVKLKNPIPLNLLTITL